MPVIRIYGPGTRVIRPLAENQDSMKKAVLTLVWIMVLTGIGRTQKIGINTSTPNAPLTIHAPANGSIPNFEPIVDILYNIPGAGYVTGLRSKVNPGNNAGIGGQFEGGQTGATFFSNVTGIESSVEASNNEFDSYGIKTTCLVDNPFQYSYGTYSQGTNQNGYAYGVYGLGGGTNNISSYGVYGFSYGQNNINIGVYGGAAGAISKNWAGYFEQGNVFIQNQLGIGHDTPAYDIDVLSNQSVIRLTSSSNSNGSVLELKNTTANPTLLGAINFSTSGTTPGQIGYQNDHTFRIRVNGTDQLRINAAGLTGIGRTPSTNKLEVEGNASKSSAGDWLANSDARLKKNIQALQPEEMLKKLLALQGVTYEWDDDQTGTQRPTGTQYGFIAQNIQQAFPSLVEVDARGYLQTAYGTYDAMMVEAIRFLYQENQELREKITALEFQIGRPDQSLAKNVSGIRN